MDGVRGPGGLREVCERIGWFASGSGVVLAVLVEWRGKRMSGADT
jgi:hypothetical protein